MLAYVGLGNRASLLIWTGVEINTGIINGYLPNMPPILSALMSGSLDLRKGAVKRSDHAGESGCLEMRDGRRSHAIKDPLRLDNRTFVTLAEDEFVMEVRRASTDENAYQRSYEGIKSPNTELTEVQRPRLADRVLT